MITFFVFRHGETDWNASERFQGHLDIPLNDQGRAQSRLLAERLRPEGIEGILSSDLQRARETAQIIAKILKLPLEIDARIREAHLGEAQGMTREEIESRFGTELIHRWRSPFATDADIAYPGGESGQQVMDRSFQCLEAFAAQSPWKKVGVATHGGVIRRIMQKLRPPEADPVPIPNGVLYRLQFHPDESRWSIGDLSLD